MKRKLLVLNAALVILLSYAGFELRRAWLAAQAREAARLNRKIRPAAPPPIAPLPAAPAVSPGSYADIAQQMLFDKSRNPNVVVVVETPPPPPPKPMPPLPVYHGQMNIGSGPTAILSQTANSIHQMIRPGEQIGQFKLLDVNSEEIVFEWDGKEVRRRVDNLIDRSAVAAQVVASAGVRTEQPAAPPPPVIKTPTGPGAELGRDNMRACDPSDSLPAGTVKDGYRKVIAATPFGESCRWDPVGR
ncbi:MAG: hypothetical protein C5B51_25580 [Terriglobia bacterium]|nr:MAG: hypothetical protein C5B51_25580 [Terriglobia bacterium]